MAGHHLALYNFGLHVDDYDSPAVEGFRLRITVALARAFVESLAPVLPAGGRAQSDRAGCPHSFGRRATSM